MNYIQETINHQDPVMNIKIARFSFKKDATNFFCPWHVHKEAEFILVEEGCMEVHAAANKQRHLLRSGDVCLVGASQIHSAYKPESAPLSYIVLHLDLPTFLDSATLKFAHLFCENYHPLDDLNYILREYPTIQKKAAVCLKKIYREMQTRPYGYELSIGMAIRQLLWLLISNDDRDVFKKRIHHANPLDPVLTFINQHLEEEFDLKQACEMVHMSYNYFSKYFKTTMGMSFKEYVNRQKITQAARLLLTGEESIEEAAAAVGFHNLSYFYRLFDRYHGCTPRAFVQKTEIESPSVTRRMGRSAVQEIIENQAGDRNDSHSLV